MTNNNRRLSGESVSILQSLIGSTIKRLIHEQFVYAPVSYGIVGIEADSGLYKITSSLQDCDLMGSEDELCFLGVDKAFDADFHEEETSNIPFIDSFVGQKLLDVILIHDTVDQYDGGQQISSLTYTKAIIFVFESKEYCFEQNWFYQEIIRITQGHDLAAKLASPESEWNEEGDWAEGCFVKCQRNIEHLK